MDDSAGMQNLTIEVVYEDDELLELAATVNTRLWRGGCTAYIDSTSLLSFARELLQFTNGGPSAMLDAGTSGMGQIGLRFYLIDRSGHIAGHVQLASRPIHDRPEQVSSLAVEFSAENWALSVFAKQLEELAKKRNGRASMEINEGT